MEAEDLDLLSGTVFSSGSNSTIVTLASVPLRLERSLREDLGGGGGDGDDDILAAKTLDILCIVADIVGCSDGGQGKRWEDISWSVFRCS